METVQKTPPQNTETDWQYHIAQQGEGWAWILTRKGQVVAAGNECSLIQARVCALAAVLEFNVN
jgi:hypothetical protein